MFYRRIVTSIATLALALTASTAVFATAADKKNATRKNAPVSEPLNLAILVQDDLISQVGNKLGVTRDFIRSLPGGSRVMVGYITTGTLQVRQPFTSY